MAGPRIPRLLARLFLPPRDRESIIGDLEELYARRSKERGSVSARLNYLRDVLASVVARRTAGKPRPPKQRRTTAGRSSILEAFFADLRQAVRTLRREPVFVVIVAGTLGVGIGSAGAVFGMANQLLLRPPPGVADPAGVTILDFQIAEGRAGLLSGPNLEDLRRGATLFEGFAAHRYMSVVATVDRSRPIQTRALAVYGDYFELLGVRPIAGRLLREDETGPNADPFVAVISEHLWEVLFNRSPEVVGRQFRADGVTLKVLGVAGGGFRSTDRYWEIDVWLPSSALVPLANYPRERFWSRDVGRFQDFVVRLRPGVSLEAGQEQIQQILRGLAAGDSNAGSYLSRLRATLYAGPLSPRLRRLAYPTLGLLAGTVMLVLLIACANAANLLLVRGVYRRGEVAVRRALGASTGRITRQRLVESLLLGSLGTLAGLAIAWLIGLTMRGESLWGLPNFEGFVWDARALGFASVAVLVTTLLFGTLPAALAGRFDLAGGLIRDAGTQTTGRHSVMRHGISVLQIALSLTLLIAGILLGRTVRNLYALDPGLSVEGVFASTLHVSDLEIEAAMELEVLQRELLEAVKDVPGVQEAALDYYGPYMIRTLARIALPDRSDAEFERADLQWASPGWFDLLRVRTVSGRTFRGPEWSSSGPLRTVLTAPLARRLFGHTDVVGRTVLVGLRELDEAEIVGVVGDLRLTEFRGPPDEAFILPFPPRGVRSHLTILFRTSSAGLGVADDVRTALEAVVPGLPVPQPTPLTDRIDVQLSEQRIFARLLGLLSSLGVLLAAVGLYGVVAFEVAGRKREFGIRIALGADGPRISKLVFGWAATIVVWGMLLGLFGAYVLSRVIESRLFGVEAVDATSYVAAVALLAVVALLACWVPAVTAVRVDPVATLRLE